MEEKKFKKRLCVALMPNRRLTNTYAEVNRASYVVFDFLKLCPENLWYVSPAMLAAFAQVLTSDTEIEVASATSQDGHGSEDECWAFYPEDPASPRILIPRSLLRKRGPRRV